MRQSRSSDIGDMEMRRMSCHENKKKKYSIKIDMSKNMKCFAKMSRRVNSWKYHLIWELV